MRAEALEREAARSENKPSRSVAAPAEAKSDVAAVIVVPGAADIAALVAAKLRWIVPMTAIYATAYLGLSALSGFAKPLLSIKVLGPVNLGFALIALNYLIAWVVAVFYARIANRRHDPLVQKIAARAAPRGARP